MSNISKRRREGTRSKIKSMGDHKEFLRRITRTLYYGQLPSLPCLSLPVTEISCEMWSVAQRGRSLRRLRTDAAAGIARGACVSPCALVLALLYLERLNACNPDYLAAAAPADLFLVSLMVGNKFLQDDGEDDDVMSSEWAASGGIPLNQLKKLEVEFLNAIDWNVFVSEESFEAGLHWLERRVALRQARSRGFFTYADLAAACDGARLAAAAAAAARAAAAALALGCLAGLAACLPALNLGASRTGSPAPVDPTLITNNIQPELYVNDTMSDRLVLPPIDSSVTDQLKCCTEWMQYRETTETRKSWFDAAILPDWKLEPWWSKTSVLNWLYQRSLVDPMQRWLERINEYADLLRRELVSGEAESRGGRCASHQAPPHCVRQALNLSKLSAWAAALSDR